MAAIYCKQLTANDLAKHSSKLLPTGSKCFLLADIGGGTVDVTAFQVNADTLDIISEPTGNNSGGYRVNLNFKKFLENLVDDEEFGRYLKSGDRARDAKHKAHLEYLLSCEFETQKKIFADKENNPERETSRFGISLHKSFIKTYHTKLSHLNDSNIQFTEDDEMLSMSYPVMKNFFSPVMEAIVETISKVLDDIDGQPDTLFLVGGFGGSPYVTEVLSKELGEHFCYIIPADHDHAVVSGAVLFRHNPSIIRGRKIGATYGVDASIPFEESKHDKSYKVKLGEIYHCDNIFSAIVEKDSIVYSDEVFLKTHSLADPKQRKMHLNLYASPETDVWYTTGKRPEQCGNSTTVEVIKIGDVSIPLAPIDMQCHALPAGGGRVQERIVDVFFDFSRAEIHVLACDHTSKVKVKCTVDSLS